MGLFRKSILPTVTTTFKERSKEFTVDFGVVSRNTSILIAITFVTSIISVFFIAFLARRLGVAAFGLYGLAVTYSELARMFIDMGTGKLLTREISRNEDIGPTLIPVLLTPKLLLFFIVAIGIALISYAARYPIQTSIAVLISVFIGFLKMMSTSARSVFHAYEKMEYDAVGLILERIVSVGLSIMFVVQGWGLLGVLFALSIGGSLDMLVSWWLVRKDFVDHFERPGLSEIKSNLVVGVPLFLFVFFNTLYLRANVILLERISGEVSTGLFNAAFQILSMILILPQMISFSIFPLYTRTAEAEGSGSQSIYGKSFIIMLLLGGVFSVGTISLAKLGVLTMFGEEFEQSTAILRILSLTLPFTFLYTALFQLLIAHNYERVVAIVCVIVAGLSILLNILILPQYDVIGTSWIFVFTELITSVICFYFIFRTPTLKSLLVK